MDHSIFSLPFFEATVDSSSDNDVITDRPASDSSSILSSSAAATSVAAILALFNFVTVEASDVVEVVWVDRSDGVVISVKAEAWERIEGIVDIVVPGRIKIS